MSRYFIYSCSCDLDCLELGSEFNNFLDTELMEMLGIEHRLTTPYHPQVCMIYIHRELALIICYLLYMTLCRLTDLSKDLIKLFKG